MTSTFVITFIGDDKPGQLEQLADTISAHGGNWLESRMSQLAGHFVGITRVRVASAQTQALQQALEQLSGGELTIRHYTDKTPQPSGAQSFLHLNVIGNDRPGIVQEISRALAACDINVCEMNTHITSAPMTAEALFEAFAEIAVPATQSLDALSDILDGIADQLGIDIILEEAS